jgi:hypothetical protein
VGERNRAYAAYGGSVYVAYGILAIALATLIGNAVNLTTNQFLSLWGETIVMLILGLCLLISALLVGSSSDFRRIAGGMIGVISALIGAILAPALINTTTGLISQVGVSGFLSSGGSAQLTAAYGMLFVSSFVVMLVGFPLGMIGSFQFTQEKEDQSLEQP